MVKLFRIISFVFLGIQILIGILVLLSVINVAQLSGAARAQDVFVLFPLLFAKKISYVALFFFLISLIHRYLKKSPILSKSYYIASIVSILLPHVLLKLFMFIIVATR